MNTKNPKLTEDYIIPLINNYIATYEQNPKMNWQYKVIAMNLFYTVSIKTYTARSKKFP